MVTVKGSVLALATAAKPLLRSGAERLVSELVRRAKLVNAHLESQGRSRIGIREVNSRD
jgi:hypothetical protein